MAMSPALEKRCPVSDGIYHPPLVGDGDSKGVAPNYVFFVCVCVCFF
jgi:hypothetical protein